MASSSAAVSTGAPLSIWPAAGPRPGYFPTELAGGPPFGTSISGVPGERKRQRIAAYGVCRDADGRILLARASPSITLQGRWFLPGGGVKHGEDPVDSLTREIEEESGLTRDPRAAARRPLRRADDPRRHQPPHRAPHLPGGVLGGHAAARGRRHDRRRRMVHARGGAGLAAGPLRPDRRGPARCERDGSRARPYRRPRCTMWSSSAAASAGSSPPAPSSGRPSGSPSSTGPTTISSSRLLYQVATGILSEGQIAPAIRDVLRNYPALRVILGEVEDIDVEGREVHVDEFGKPLTIGYDSLIVAGGASSSYFGHDEFRAASCAMKTPRRRPGAAGQHLRRLRAGRGRDGPRGAPAPHDLRRRRGRTDRRGDGGPAPRALPAGAPPQLPHDRPGRHPRRAGGGRRRARRGPWAPTCRA